MHIKWEDSSDGISEKTTKHRSSLESTRRSSYMFEYSLVAGLTASGADAYLLHVTTTPSVSYVVRTENFDCGIMISASHNPFYDNGIKVINGLGQKLEADIEAQIEAYIDDGTPKIPFATREDIGRTVDFAAGRNRYIGHLISIPTKSFKNMRVGLDCSNGSASSVAKSVFDAIGAKTYVIHNEPDGNKHQLRLWFHPHRRASEICKRETPRCRICLRRRRRPLHRCR